MQQQDPMATLMAALGESMAGRSPSNALLEAEAAGQAALVNSTELPADMHGDRAIFEGMGIKFGEPNPRDPMFLPTTLPVGRRKEATEHAMWSRLVDDKGRERAMIFYKAAFYDRSAHMSPSRRYRTDYANKDFDEATQWGAFDGKALLWATERVPELPGSATREQRLARYDQTDALRKQACDWLNANRPDWQDPLAYWNE